MGTGTQSPICMHPAGKQRYQVLTADLEAAFCLFLVQEYYASVRTNETNAW